MTLLQVGDSVRRQHLWDGSRWAGQPTGPVLTVTEIETVYPVECRVATTVINLSDGRWAYPHNLHRVADGG